MFLQLVDTMVCPWRHYCRGIYAWLSDYDLSLWRSLTLVIVSCSLCVVVHSINLSCLSSYQFNCAKISRCLNKTSPSKYYKHSLCLSIWLLWRVASTIATPLNSFGNTLRLCLTIKCLDFLSLEPFANVPYVLLLFYSFCYICGIETSLFQNLAHYEYTPSNRRLRGSLFAVGRFQR